MCGTFYDKLPPPQNGNGRKIREAAYKKRLSPLEKTFLFIILENPLVEEEWITPEGIISEAKRLAKCYPDFNY